MKTSYDWGWAYAEWLEHEGLEGVAEPVDYDRRRPEIPPSDASLMRMRGIPLDDRAYWAGFNARVTSH